MKKFFLLFFSFSTFFAESQTAQEIIDNHFKSTGGYKAWNQLQTIYMEGNLYTHVSQPLKIILEHKKPYYKRVSFIINGIEKLSEGYDGKQAFTYNELNGKNKQLYSYQPDDFETDILNYRKKGFIATLVGKDFVSGRRTFHINLSKEGRVQEFWFDAQTYYLLKSKDKQETINYSDFKKFNGLVFATRMDYTPLSGNEYSLLFSQIIPNKKIPLSRFKFK